MIVVRRTFDTKGLEVVKDATTLTLTFEEFSEVMQKGTTLMFATHMLQSVDTANQPPEEPKGVRDADGNFG